MIENFPGSIRNDLTSRFALQRVWSWQFRAAAASSVWVNYDGPESDIQKESSIEKECYHEQTSTLRRNLQMSDIGRSYRCATRWKGRLYLEFAAEQYVGVIIPQGETASLALRLKRPPRERKIPGFDSRLRRGDFCRSSHTRDLKIGSSVADLPGAWRHRVSAGIGWPGVSILLSV